MADGSIALMCAGRVSMVSAVAAAIHAPGLDAANHHLDGEHNPHVLRLAFARAGSPVGASWLGYAAGIRICGDCRCNHRVSPVQATGIRLILRGLGVEYCSAI